MINKTISKDDELELRSCFDSFLWCPDQHQSRRLFDAIQKARANFAYQDLKKSYRFALERRFGIVSKSILRAKILAGVCRLAKDGSGISRVGEAKILEWLGVDASTAKAARKKWKKESK